jgi:cell wall-associated NlpC family hydrolase
VVKVTFLVCTYDFLIAIFAMSLTENRIATYQPRKHSRRHARHTSTNWVRRAGVASGVLSVAALTAAAAPPAAERTGEQPTTTEVTQTLDLSQLRAAHATAQAAVNYQLLATQEESFSDALKAAHARKAAQERADAAKKAAQERADAAKKAARPTRSRLSSVPSSGPSSAPSSASPAGGSMQRFLDFLQGQVGKSYVLGGTGPYSYDCSGLAQAAFRTLHIDLPRTSEEQSRVGTPVSLSHLVAGDLLFWGSEGNAYHVAIYIGGGEFIGAQNPSDGIVRKPLTYSEPDFAVRVA